MKVILDKNTLLVIKTCLSQFPDIVEVEIGEDDRGEGYITFRDYGAVKQRRRKVA